MKSEVKTIVQRCSQLEGTQHDAQQRLQLLDTDISEAKLTIQQYEAKMKLNEESLHETEHKKRALEEEMDSLKEEAASLRTQAKMYVSQLDEHKEKSANLASATEMKDALQVEMQSHREAHQRQLAELRNEITEKQSRISGLTESTQKITLAHEKLQADYDKLKSEESEKAVRLAELSLAMDRREQAKQDLKGLEETVAKELQTLHNLRKLFVQDLQTKVKKSQNKTDDDEEETMSSHAQKQKISFLENNLDQLTKVHKQVCSSLEELIT